MAGPRLLVHVEGQTEENFVNELLAPHLYERGFASVSARLVGNARQRSRRGGIRGWDAVASDILRHLHADRSCVATTIVDYYALPSSGSKAWPSRATAATQPIGNQDRAVLVEQGMQTFIDKRLGSPPETRFVPFVAMHEYEGWLFSDPATFANAVDQAGRTADFEAVRSAFATPEDINDSPQTAPSKRVEALVPGYQKPFHGVLAALEIGLATIRSQCPHVDDWLTRLEALTAP